MIYLIAICCCFVLIANGLKKHDPNAKRVVVQLAHDADADRVAAEHGYANLGELESLRGYHVFEELESRKRQVCHISFKQLSSLLCFFSSTTKSIFFVSIRSSCKRLQQTNKQTFFGRILNIYRRIRT